MTGARELLQRHFGYSSFTQMQQSIIKDVLEGRDVFVLMPTGSGKSLCYQFPSVVNKGLTVVISPLIALMKDQVDSLRANGIGASFINSTLSRYQIDEAKSRLADGKDKILYIAPERLSSPEFLDFISSLRIELFAIDEAHCISEWGHDFRPEYRKLRMLRENFPGVPIIALTATAVPEVQDDIIQHLKLSQPRVYKASFNRPNLNYFIRHKQDAYEQIVDYISTRRKDSGIIYCNSRQTTENLAEKLRDDGFRALPYHAGLSAAEREENQEKFIREDVEIIVATIAFGMGINKTNVRYVIHYDLPKNIESYYQETGRAGRDGLESDCILFFSYGDKVKIKVIIEQKKNPKKKRIAYEKLNMMVRFCESRECRRKMLLQYFGEEHNGGCGKCDACLEPREKMDGTEIAKTAIQAIMETRQRFGMNYIISLLAGKESKKKTMYSHNQLKSFGAGRNYTKDEWRLFIRELINMGVIDVFGDKYPVLKLNKKSLDLLYGKAAVEITKPENTREKMPLIKEQCLKEGGEELTADKELFEILRSLRKKIADAERVPPYIVFPDTTLREMAIYYPQSLQDVNNIHGVGEVKISKYGTSFTEAIAAYCKARGIAPIKIPKRGKKSRNIESNNSDTYEKTLELCRKKLSIEEMAKERVLSPSTITGHIEKLLLSGKDIDISKFVSNEKAEAIINCINGLKTQMLTPIKEKLGENYSYDEIRIARAKLMAGRIYHAK